MKKILIVEDDVMINNVMVEALEKQNLPCTQAFSGTEALLCIKTQEFALILLDLMLPGKKGEDVLKEIREFTRIPVIVVSAKDELDSKVDLLTLGADDYITKPFQIKELVARVLVQLRRNGDKQDEEILYHKELRFNRNCHSVTLCGSELTLTKQEFSIFELLLSHPNRVFRKQEMYEYAWEEYFFGEDKTLNVHISNMRNKMKSITAEPYIETVWGIGFKLAN